MTKKDNVLLAAMVERLQGQLSDPAAAARLAQYLFDVALTWRPATVALDQVDTIIAFSLGLREEVDGDPMAVAGPVNEEIAGIVADMAAKRPEAQIYAQWEIARVLHHRYGLAEVFSVERVINERGMVYLSTQGVAEGAIAEAGSDPAALGITAAVGHHDHAWRCVDMCRRLGIDAYVAEGVQLATGYDARSAQNFTHTPDIWQIYDLAIRVGQERGKLIGA
jgi:hypothetical protein